MNRKNKALLKDRILDILDRKNNKLVFISTISDELGKESSLVYYLLLQMANEGFVGLNSAGSHENILPYIETKGHFFLKIEGGYIRRYTQYVIKTTWTIVKIVSVTANTLVIMYLSYLTYNSQDKTNRLEKENELLKRHWILTNPK